MYHGKRAKGWNLKSGVLLASLVLLTALTVGTTVAFLIDNTNTVENTFQPAHVSCAIEEKFDEITKEYVKVRNTGNVSAYIRARVLVSWTKDGKVIQKPENCTAIIQEPASGWHKEGDYYYYTIPVSAGGVTSELIPKAIFTDQDATGAKLRIDILAEAIQADGLGADSAQEAWTKAGGGTS